jgi:hypothetical protein
VYRDTVGGCQLVHPAVHSESVDIRFHCTEFTVGLFANLYAVYKPTYNNKKLRSLSRSAFQLCTENRSLRPTPVFTTHFTKNFQRLKFVMSIGVFFFKVTT